MTMITRRATIGLLAGLSALAFAASANAADSTITVSLWDKGPDSAMMDEMHPMGMAMGNGMMAEGMPMAMFGITLDMAQVPAGKVTFAVTNTSKEMIHEMVVSKITSIDQALPYLKDENKVDEDAAGHLGEVAELDPGKSGELTLELEPGTYILYCNIPGHYISGMWQTLTVTP